MEKSWKFCPSSNKIYIRVKPGGLMHLLAWQDTMMMMMMKPNSCDFCSGSIFLLKGGKKVEKVQSDLFTTDTKVKEILLHDIIMELSVLWRW